MEKLIIIGSGMAGLTAAIYAARSGLKPEVISGKQEGGQLMLTTDVENFPGFPEGVQGPDLVSKLREQAKKFGTRFMDGDVTGLAVKGKNSYELTIDGSGKVEALSVIVATGASERLLGLESEKKYWSRGVHTCAACDGYFYSGKDVIVVGGGDSACEEALFLSKLANSVTVIHRRAELRASKVMQERILSNNRIKVVWNSVVEEILGDGKKVTGIRLKNINDDKISELKTAAVFLAIGHVPNTAAFKGILDLDEDGYLKADSHLRTNLPGVFAAGDVCDKVYKQAITASGMGCQAEIGVERYLAGLL